MIAKCNNNPGELRKSPNCINATSAENRLKPRRDIE
ncbi:EexN family lipoprotein [Xylella fastidiosa]|nr:EexN family lipoprotein [Xylella fastidiosa]UIT50812.1 EexN family lipoprotein [Xylella fastidiosa subsp. fastidiosa]